MANTRDVATLSTNPELILALLLCETDEEEEAVRAEFDVEETKYFAGQAKVSRFYSE